MLIVFGFGLVPSRSLSEAEAQEKLRSVGAELAWPGFKNDISLVEFGFSDQASLDTPAGGISDNIKVVSTSPYIAVIDDFLSSRECDFLKAFGATRLKPAMVVQSDNNWYDTQSQTRNNEQVWLTQTEERGTPILRHILKRIHRTARVPDEFAEALQIGKYGVSQKYEGHIDTDPRHNVGRPATFITYLDDVEEGGHTLFPIGRNDCTAIWRKNPNTGEQVYGAKLCCDSPELDAPETVRVRPKKGRGVLFFSHKPDGSVNGLSTHIGCPVNKGEKWIAQRWLRYEPYNKVDYSLGPGWDSRFDGPPQKQHRVGFRHEVQLRSLSQHRPKAYLEEHFLSMDEASALYAEAFKKLHFGFSNANMLSGMAAMPEAVQNANQVPKSITISKAQLDENPVLNNLTQRVHVLARLPLQEEVSLEFRRLNVGDYDLPTIENNAPAVKVLIYLPSQVGELVRGGELILPAADKMLLEKFGGGKNDPTSTVDRCSADLDACCEASMFKVDAHRGDAVLLYPFGQDGRLDLHAAHGHCKLKSGESWIAEWRIWFPQLEQDQPASRKMQGQPACRFENQSDEEVQIFWAPPGGGKEAPMGNVPAGQAKTLNSYPGHDFKVRRMDGSLVDKFHVGSTPTQRFLITTKKEL
jgi:prolyl 4-hydroxylase